MKRQRGCMAPKLNRPKIVVFSRNTFKLALFVFTFCWFLFLVIFLHKIDIQRNIDIVATKDVYQRDKPKTSSVLDCLNVHIWKLDCNFTFEVFLEYPIFPTAPYLQLFTNTFDTQWLKTRNIHGSFGQRLFGFVRAPISGNFRFSLFSQGSAELWVSKDRNWQNTKLVCKLLGRDHERSSSIYRSSNTSASYQVSSEVFLESGRFYFIEILHVQNSHHGNHSLQIKWQTPRLRNFEEIEEQYIFSFTQEHQTLENMIREIPAVKKNKYRKGSILETRKFLGAGTTYLNLSEVLLALPSCPYTPGYIGKPVTFQYKTVESFVNPSYVYPEVKHAKIKDGKWIPWFPLDEKIAKDVSQEYVKHLEMAYPGKYQLKKIVNVEQKPNWPHENAEFYRGEKKDGDRYFLEIELWNKEKKESVVLSEYIYRHSNNGTLCYPKGLQWNRKVPVYFLVSSRNLGKWLWHFIQNIEQIYLDTKDENLHAVIYDYNTADIDVEMELKRSSFQNYKVLKSTHKVYSKTYSINRAADSVSDPHAIVVSLDMHLEIPSLFTTNVRKHCIEGKMFYTPIICRLDCGASSQNPSGSWDPWGYGMFGVYKSDWDRFKGYDEEKFKNRWGGEDWDIVDRAYKVGLEFERSKHADFYHYYHSKNGMW